MKKKGTYTWDFPPGFPPETPHCEVIIQIYGKCHAKEEMLRINSCSQPHQSKTALRMVHKRLDMILLISIQLIKSSQLFKLYYYNIYLIMTYWINLIRQSNLSLPAP